MFQKLSYPSIVAALSLSACISSKSFIKSELYFGLSIPTGGMVDSQQWQHFVDTAISTRFPDGLSIVDVSGQWKDLNTGDIDKEPSRMVIVLYAQAARREASAKLNAIKQSYCKTFQQQAVMRVDSRVRVEF